MGHGSVCKVSGILITPSDIPPGEDGVESQDRSRYSNVLKVVIREGFINICTYFFFFS